MLMMSGMMPTNPKQLASVVVAVLSSFPSSSLDLDLRWMFAVVVVVVVAADLHEETWGCDQDGWCSSSSSQKSDWNWAQLVERAGAACRGLLDGGWKERKRRGKNVKAEETSKSIFPTNQFFRIFFFPGVNISFCPGANKHAKHHSGRPASCCCCCNHKARKKSKQEQTCPWMYGEKNS